MSNLSTHRIHVSILKTTGEVVVYDLSARCVLHSITDYLLFLSHTLGKKALTVEQAAWRLARFYSYLLASGKGDLDIDNATLVAYRTQELAQVALDRSHRGSLRATRSTINQKLSVILGWMAWAQAHDLVPIGTIGPTNARITAFSVGRYRTAGAIPNPGDKISSPLYLSGAGDSGSAPYVTARVVETATEVIVKTAKNSYISERNTLFIDIARHTGFRRGSINSLTTDQFEPDRLLNWQEDTFPVTPSVQKLDYENTFEIPTELALRVLSFIEGARHELLARLKVGNKTTLNKVFLSMRTGRPISSQSMTSALRPAMRAAGATKGKVVHAIRGLFAAEGVDGEAIRRRDAGLDTSTMSIALAMSWKLGQKDPASLVPYVAQALSNTARRDLAKKRLHESEE